MSNQQGSNSQPNNAGQQVSYTRTSGMDHQPAPRPTAARRRTPRPGSRTRHPRRHHRRRRTHHPPPVHRPHRMCRVISIKSPLKTKVTPQWHQTSSCTDTTELSRTPCPAATASHTRHASCLARTALHRNRTPPRATPALCRKHSQCRVTLAVLDSRRTRSRVTPVPRSRSLLSLARTARRPPPSTPPPHNRAATSLVLQDRLRL